MKLTKHARIRCQQRGIRTHHAKLIKAFGEAQRVPGNAVKYRLTKKGRKELEIIFKQGIQLLDKLKEQAIIYDEANETIITCYHNTN
jgi:DNA-binding PadR family transcriptional regulator